MPFYSDALSQRFFYAGRDHLLHSRELSYPEIRQKLKQISERIELFKYFVCFFDKR